MPYDTEQEEEEARRKRAQTAGGILAPKQPPPPAPAASTPVRFGRPFTAQEKARQADALIKKLRSTGDY